MLKSYDIHSRSQSKDSPSSGLCIFTLSAIGANRSGKSPTLSLCIKRQSRALQTLTLRVLALLTMARPFSKSPSLSKYACTTPAPVSITGTRALSRTNSISFLPPRGMHKSTYPTAPSNSAVASCVGGISATTSAGKPSARRVWWIRSTIASLL